MRPLRPSPPQNDLLRIITQETGLDLRRLDGRQRAVDIVAARCAYAYLAEMCLSIPRSWIAEDLNISRPAVTSLLTRLYTILEIQRNANRINYEEVSDLIARVWSRYIREYDPAMMSVERGKDLDVYGGE